MSKRQFVLLFLINLSGWALGSGLMPLLPVYATRLGATPALVGYYLSFSFVMMAVGTLASGWVFGLAGRAKAGLVTCGILGVPLVWLMGRATTVWQLAVLTAAVLFILGMETLVYMAAGAYAKSHERGRVFGVLQVCGGLGAVIGGLTLGPLADRWGYPTMFAVASGTMLVAALAAFLLEERAPGSDQPEGAEATKRQAGWGVAFSLLFAAGLVAPLAYYVGLMSRSLVMDALGFGAAAISSTAVAAGIVAIPLPFVIGWLSDRAGRKTILAACYLAIATSLLVLAEATSLWHFRVAMALGATMGTTLAVGSAFAVDLVSKESLATAVAWFNAAMWIGGAAGLAAAGSAIQFLGPTPTLIAAASVGLAAVALVAAIRRPAAKPAPAVDVSA